MALPLSRNTTYAPLSQVLSFDLNDIQDQIIAGNHAAQRRITTGAAGNSDDATFPFGIWRLAATQTLSIPLWLVDGDTLQDMFITISVSSDTDDFVTFSLVRGGVGIWAAQATGTGSLGLRRDENTNNSDELVDIGSEISSSYRASIVADAGNNGDIEIHQIDYDVFRDQ